MCSKLKKIFKKIKNIFRKKKNFFYETYLQDNSSISPIISKDGVKYEILIKILHKVSFGKLLIFIKGDNNITPFIKLL